MGLLVARSVSSIRLAFQTKKVDGLQRAPGDEADEYSLRSGWTIKRDAVPEKREPGDEADEYSLRSGWTIKRDAAHEKREPGDEADEYSLRSGWTIKRDAAYYEPLREG